MFLVRLAFKNLFRSKRRTVLSTFAIVIGLFYLIVGKAFVGGIEEGIVRAAEESTISHLVIRAADYPTVGVSHPVDELVTLNPETRSWLDEHAVATVGRTMFVSTVSTGEDTLRVRSIGFDPAADEAVFPRDSWNVEGVVPKGADDGILLGYRAADLLEVALHDTVVLQVRTSRGAINALEVPITGILQSGNNVLDTSILAPKPFVDGLVRNPAPTHVAVRLKSRNDADAAVAALAPRIGEGYETFTWHDEVGELLRMQQIRRRALDILVGILLIMSAFAIANTILMAAHERVKEIGTLRALGMSQGGVLRLFLIEGTLMGVVSGALGAAAGGVVANHLTDNPLDLAELAGASFGGNLQMSTYLYAAFQWSDLLLPLGVAVGTALLASLLPARTASRMIVADAVRAE